MCPHGNFSGMGATIGIRISRFWVGIGQFKCQCNYGYVIVSQHTVIISRQFIIVSQPSVSYMFNFLPPTEAANGNQPNGNRPISRQPIVHQSSGYVPLGESAKSVSSGLSRLGMLSLVRISS